MTLGVFYASPRSFFSFFPFVMISVWWLYGIAYVASFFLAFMSVAELTYSSVYINNDTGCAKVTSSLSLTPDQWLALSGTCNLFFSLFLIVAFPFAFVYKAIDVVNLKYPGISHIFIISPTYYTIFLWVCGIMYGINAIMWMVGAVVLWENNWDCMYHPLRTFMSLDLVVRIVFTILIPIFIYMNYVSSKEYEMEIAFAVDKETDPDPRMKTMNRQDKSTRKAHPEESYSAYSTSVSSSPSDYSGCTGCLHAIGSCLCNLTLPF